MTQKSFMNRKIPTVLGLVILIAGLIVGVILVNSRTSLQTKAGPTESPKNIKITNKGSNSISISWTTDVPMTGYLRYSEDPVKITSPAGDVRDQISGTSQSYTSHYVNITGLNPNKQYYFNIGSGSQTYNDNGKPFQFRTFDNISSPPEDVISGKIINADTTAVNGAIVFLELNGIEPMSAITKSDGTWRINISSARTDAGKIPEIDKETTVLSLFVQAGTSGTATALTNTKNARPVPDITLGKNQSFIEGGESFLANTETASRSGTFELDESQLASFDNQQTGEVLSLVTFVNPAIDGELIATTTPEFKVKLATGSGLVMTVGDQSSGLLLPDGSGEFAWSPTNELAKGMNSLLVEYGDENDDFQSISRSFNVLAIGDVAGLPAFTATPSAKILPQPTEASTMPETDDENLTDSGSLEQMLGALLFGVILIVGGIYLKKKWS